MFRDEWVPVSSASLVVGAMALVLGFLVNPLSQENEDVAQVVTDAVAADGRWAAMSVMLFVAAVGLTAGLPALLTLVARVRVLGLAAVWVFAVGTVGLAGYAVASMFLRALLLTGEVSGEAIAHAAQEPGLVWFLGAWLGSFYLGLVLLAAALFRARTTPRWVPGALVGFLVSGVVLAPFGDAGTVVQFFVLAVALTGAGLAAVERVPAPASR